MSGVELAVAAVMGYFVVFGFGFLVRPELADRFGLRWVRPAGRTEVRCYYGAVSWGLAGFLGYLWNRGLEVEALTGVLILAGGLLEADYIVIEMARLILGENWLPDYVARANAGGIERVLV